MMHRALIVAQSGRKQHMQMCRAKKKQQPCLANRMYHEKHEFGRDMMEDGNEFALKITIVINTPEKNHMGKFVQ